MMPRVFAALAGQAPLDILLSLAAVPLGMLGAAFFRSAMDGMASTGAPTCTRERACVAALGLLLVGGTGYFWVGSLNLGQLTAVWVTVAYAAANGPVYGVAAGLLCGLSLALGGHDVRMAATLSVMGLLCGLPAVERRRWLLPPAAVAGWVVGYSLTPLSGPTVPFWAALAGAAAYALLPGWMLERVRALARGPEPGVRSMETAFVSQRIEHMRDALERLADVLHAWDKTAAPPAAPRHILPAPGAARCTIAEALLRPARAVRMRDAVGETAAEYLWAYPPGVPLVAPGEEVTAELVTACRALEQAGTALKHTGGSGAEEIAVL